MKLVKLFDDYLNMAAAQQNMSREEYTAHYLSESERDTLAELNDMTLGQLERIEDYAEMISERMESGQQLESWMFSQITIALDNLNAVHDAMDGVDGIEESNVNEKMKIFLNKIVSSMVSGAFGIHSSPKMRDELAAKIEATVKEVLIKYDYVVESKESDALAKEIDKAMIKIDDSMSYKDFALAVGKILKDEYGSHNFGPFMEILHKDLGI